MVRLSLLVAAAAMLLSACVVAPYDTGYYSGPGYYEGGYYGGGPYVVVPGGHYGYRGRYHRGDGDHERD
jgi:hypothetical protein